MGEGVVEWGMTSNELFTYALNLYKTEEKARLEAEELERARNEARLAPIEGAIRKLIDSYNGPADIEIHRFESSLNVGITGFKPIKIEVGNSVYFRMTYSGSEHMIADYKTLTKEVFSIVFKNLGFSNFKIENE